MPLSPRKSAVSNGSADSFVTKELQNSADKKRLRSHRRSLFEEMKITQTLIQNSINQQNRSRFKQNLKRKEDQLKKTKKQKKKLSKYSLEIQLKFRQIRNITRCFQDACRVKYQPHLIPKTLELTDVTTNLQALPPPIVIIQQPKKTYKDQQSADQRQVLKQIQEKCNLGKNYVLQKKKTRIMSNYRIKSINKISQRSKQNRCMNFTDIPPSSDGKFLEIQFPKNDFHNLYFTNYANLQNPRLSKNPWRSTIDPFARASKLASQRNQIGKEDFRSLQKFIVGGYQGQMNEFSNHIKLSKFIQTKSNFKTFQNIYNNVKQGTYTPIKDVKLNEIKEPSMLALVSFIENDVKMDESQKKDFRRRLKLLD